MWAVRRPETALAELDSNPSSIGRHLNAKPGTSRCRAFFLPTDSAQVTSGIECRDRVSPAVELQLLPLVALCLDPLALHAGVELYHTHRLPYPRIQGAVGASRCPSLSGLRHEL